MNAAAAHVITTAKGGHSEGYRPDIDGLRAVAVLAVMLYHLDKAWLPGGFLGVDVFFVISGFVVTSSLAQHTGKSSDEGVFLAFYARRAKRLMPASLFMISLVALCLTFFIPPWVPVWTERSFSSGRFALISCSNMFFAGIKGTYFDSGEDSLASNPFTHTWSLGVEEQFYLIFPLVLMAAYGSSLQMLSKCRPQFELRAILVLGAVSVCSLLVAWVLPTHLAFYLLPSRLWELASGAIVYEMLPSLANAGSRIGPRGLQAISVLLQLAAFLLIGCSLVLCPYGVTYSVPVVLPAVCGALCFIAAGSMPHAHLNASLSQWPIVYIGKISYPLYLFHWPVFVYYKWSFGLTLPPNKPMCLVLSLVLGAFTYHVVERPFRAWRPARSWIPLPLMGAGVLLVYGWLVALEWPLRAAFWTMPNYSAQPHAVYGGSQMFANVGTLQRDDSQCGCRLVDETWHRPPCAKVGPDAKDLAPCFVETPPSCWMDKERACQVPVNTAQNQKCVDGSCLRLVQAQNPKTVYVLGDSTAGDLLSGLQRAAAGHFIIDDLHMPGCAYAPQVMRDDGLTFAQNVPRGLCQEIIKNVTAKVARSVAPGDLVVLSNKNFKHLSSQEWITEYLAMLETLHRAVSMHGGNLLLFGPRPNLPWYGNQCVPTLFDQNRTHLCEVSLTAWHQQVDPMLQILQNFTHGKQGLAIFEYHGLFCDDRTCGAFVPGSKTLAFRDEHHLTRPGSEYLAPYICDFMSSHNFFPKQAVFSHHLPKEAQPDNTFPTSRHNGRRFLRSSRSKLINKTLEPDLPHTAQVHLST